MLGCCKSAAAAVAWTRLPGVHTFLAFNRSYSSELSAGAESFAVEPGSLLHILCTHPETEVHLGNQAGQEETVSLQVVSETIPPTQLQDRFLVQQLPGGRIIGEGRLCHAHTVMQQGSNFGNQMWT